MLVFREVIFILRTFNLQIEMCDKTIWEHIIQKSICFSDFKVVILKEFVF